LDQAVKKLIANKAVLLGLLLIAITGLFVRSYFQSSPISHCNILLISIDTCRADHLGCYGQSRPLTPNIDKLASEAVRFENAVSTVPLTLPSHCTMLTGMNPPQHGVHDNLDYRCGDEELTLAEILKEKGFTTAALVSAFVLDARFGLDQGFDEYDDKFADTRLIGNMSERPGQEATERTITWLKRNRDNRFFYFLHYYDPHFDYRPPEPFASRYQDDPYAAEVAYTDQCIGEVVDELKKLGLYDSTLIILTADHGEMKGEHDELGHSYFIYQGALQVPLIVKLPGQSQGKVVKQLAGVVDIVPTICGLLEEPTSNKIQGIDLSPHLLRSPPSVERYVYCESLTPTKYGANSLLGVVGDGWKYIQTTRPELYDLSADPTEHQNLIESEAEQAEMLKSELAFFLEQAVTQGSENHTAIDIDARRRLESLGYVGGSQVEEEFTFDQSKQDPKDALRLHHAYDRVQKLFFQNDFIKAKALCEEILAENPDLFLFQYSLGRIEYRLKEFDNAAEHFAAADRLKKNSPEVKHELGLALRDSGQLPASITAFQQAIKLKPDFALAHADLGVALAASNKSEEAIQEYLQSLKIDPNVATTHNNLGVALAAKELWQEAAHHYLRAIELKEDYYEAHANLGAAYTSTGKLDRAIEHYRRATSINPTQIAARVNLANSMEKSGDLDGALTQYLEAVSILPDSAELHSRIAKIHRAKGMPEAALQSFERAAKLAEDSPLIHYDLANAYVSVGKQEEALTHYQKAVALDPQFVMSHINLGNVLASLQKFDEAVKHYKLAIEADPAAANAYYNLAACHMAQGEVAQAVENYKQFLKFKPDAIDVLNSLAWIMATHGDQAIRNPTQAVEFAVRAVELSKSQDAAILDTLAAAYAADNDFAKAQATTRQALALIANSGNVQLEQVLREHLSLFEKQQPITDFLPPKDEN
jgi:arylsulfatase A-like enzyme/Tfp pilus assembly protein PilF